MNLVLNDLSISDIIKLDEQVSSQIVEKFVICFRELVKSKFPFSRTLDTVIDLNNIMLSPTIPIARWRNNIDRETQRAFLSMCDRQNVLDIQFDEYELTTSGRSSEALLWACLNDSIVISMASAKIWQNSTLCADLYCLIDNSTNDISILNLTDSEQLYTEQPTLREKFVSTFKEFKSGEELILKLDECFPKLKFHETAIRQLKYQVETQHLSAICNKLFEINEYFANWESGNFDSSTFKSKLTPESQATLEMYKKEHQFDFGGEKIIVSWHLRYTGNVAGRIYFYPHSITRTGWICSLGEKLPTVTSGRM